jgi:putative ABC transport system permease protein
VTGRASLGGPLDHLTLLQGHWLSGPGQIVLANYTNVQVPLGGKLTVLNAPGKPQLTVVGFAGSIAQFGDAWVTPGEAVAVRPNGAPATVQMLYTFTKASTSLDIGADVAALRAALPAGAITSYDSWLAAANPTTAEKSVNTPFVVAFALIGLVLAVLIVANVVSGAVVAGYRRIGVLKSIGFTPCRSLSPIPPRSGCPQWPGSPPGRWWATCG